MVMMVFVGILDQGFYGAGDRSFPRRVHQFVEIRLCITLKKMVVFLNKEETKTLSERKKKKLALQAGVEIVSTYGKESIDQTR
jgi:hypothetical protein